MSQDIIVNRCEHCLQAFRFSKKSESSRCKCPFCGNITRVAEFNRLQQSRETIVANGHSAETQDETSQSVEVSSTNASIPRQAGSSIAPSPVRRVGRFELKRRLGAGAFGEVWEAVDGHLGRRVAIKLPIIPMSDQRRVKRFHTEAQAAARLAHPNIVAVYDAGMLDTQHYLAIEFVDGRPLSETVAERRLTQMEAAHLVSRLAQALGYAHERSIVHRDIKPQNIVVAPDGTPKLVDFGLAKLLEQDAGQTIDGTVMGTPAFMAPEQAKGEVNRIGPHSDQYSLGAVLYWLITHRNPFDGPRIAIIAQVIESEPEKPRSVIPSVDPRLEAICLKAISKIPEDRYPSCYEFSEDLQRFINNQDPLAKPPAWWKQTTRFLTRYPREAAVASIAALLFCIVLGVSIIGYTRAATLAVTAEEARHQASLELVKQQELKAKLANQLVEVENAKKLAIQAKTNSESKRNALIAANQGLQSIQNTNQALDAVQGNLLRDLDESQALKMKIEIEANPDYAIIAARDAIQAENWSLAIEYLQLTPESHRALPWKLLAHFTVQKSTSLVFYSTPKLSIEDISFFRWDSSNQLLRVKLKNGDLQLLEGDHLKPLALIVDRNIKPDQEFLFDKRDQVLTAIPKSIRLGLAKVNEGYDLIERGGVLIGEKSMQRIIGIGFTNEKTRSTSSRLCIAQLDDTRWNELWSRQLEGQDWKLQKLRSEGTTHTFRLEKQSGSPMPTVAYAMIDLRDPSAPNVSFSKDDNLAIGRASEVRDEYWEDEVFDTFANSQNGAMLWTLRANLVEFQPLQPISVKGLQMQIPRHLQEPRFAFDRDSRIFAAVGGHYGVCHLKFRELPNE